MAQYKLTAFISTMSTNKAAKWWGDDVAQIKFPIVVQSTEMETPLYKGGESFPVVEIAGERISLRWFEYEVVS